MIKLILEKDATRRGQLLFELQAIWSNSIHILFLELQKLSFNLTSSVAFVIPDYAKVSHGREWIKWVQFQTMSMESEQLPVFV